MTAELLIRELERASQASGAISRLRLLILNVAASGRLVRSEPTRRLNSAGQGLSWEVPGHWDVVPFADLTGIGGTFVDGDWVESKDQDPSGDVRLTQLADVGVGHFRDRSSRFMRREVADRLNCTYLNPGDILIARMPDPLGRACIFPGDPSSCVTVVDVAMLRTARTDVDGGFVVQVLNSSLFGALVASKASGTTRQRISRGNLGRLPFPLPPLAEQYRIVAKVDELMAMCDELEAAQTKREARRDRLRATSLRNLVAPEEPKENARFFLRHSARMITSPEHVAGVRQAIWDLAVRGRLVPQDSADGAAKDLLGQILRLKSRTTSSRPRANSELTASNSSAACQLPESWTWAQWQDVTLRIGDLDHAMPEAVATEGYPYVSPRDFRPNNVIDFDGAKRISASDYLRLSAKIRPERGDLIYPRYGTIGETRLVSTDREFLASYSCAVIKISDELTDSRYQYTFSRSDIGQVQAAAAVNQGTQPNVGIMSIKAFRFPLPPLAEQRRIVAKVDELMALCNELEQSLAAEQTKRARLLEALLHDVLEDPLSARGREPLGAR